MRCFVAIELPEATRGALRRIQDDLRAGLDRLRWVRPDGIHLTLRFLGEVAAERAGTLSAALGRRIGGSVPPFALSVRGLGIFPPRGRPRVLWIGLAGSGTGDGDGLEALKRLHGRVEEACAEAGFPGEGRPFHPHLTLARVAAGRPDERIPRLVAERRDAEGGAFAVTAVCLFQSILRPSGTEYRKIKEFGL
jgi:2'-5' RNA ligase